MNRLTLIVLLSLIGSTAFAEDYHLFTELIHSNSTMEDYQPRTGFTVQNYFSEQEALGPLDQFSFLEDTSNVRFSHVTVDGESASLIGGSYYVGQFAIGGEYLRTNDFSFKSFHADYFLLSNLKARLLIVPGADRKYEGVVGASLQYDHNLGGNDYIGFETSVYDDEEQVKSIKSTYFKNLGGEQHLVISGFYSQGENNSYWSASGKYYFNNRTGVEASLDEYDRKTFGVSHFLSSNLSIRANIELVDAPDEYEKDTTTYRLIASYQL